jgi:soluble lytic murein transglycosylase
VVIMPARYALMAFLFLVAVAVPTLLARDEAALLDPIQEPDIPRAVHEAASQGRYWRASQILGEYLAVTHDSTPHALLVASRLSAARGDWPAVSSLLEGRSWLDRVDHGEGWRLLGMSRIEQGQLREGSRALGRYLEQEGHTPRERGVESLRRGLALGAAGQTLIAIQALDQAAEELPWMADWAHLFAAEILAPTGDTAEVRRRLDAAGPDLIAARGWRIKVQAARQAGDLTRARQVALAAARSAGPPATRAAAWATLGNLRVSGGDPAGAREAYRSAMEGAPLSAAAVEAARGLSQLGPTPDEWRMIAAIYHRHGNQGRAIAGFEAYLASGRGTAEERATARLQLGTAMMAAGRLTDAERRLLALASEDVPTRIAAEALYQAGRAQLRRGRGAEARRTLLGTADRFPGQDAAARALYLLADLQHDELDMGAARANYRRAADAAPTLNEAGLALMRLGGLEYLDGAYDVAASVFQEYRRLHPHGRRIAQASYWAARSLLATGQHDEAHALLRDLRRTDPLSYYGIRAGQLLGEPALGIPMAPEPPRRDRTDQLVRAAIRRVDVLADLGRRQDVTHEVERLRAHFARQDGGDYALAEALNERGYPLTAISMGWDIHRREGAWNPRILRIIYPFPFQGLVLPAARDARIDPYLVAAVIRRESAFNPVATSSAGAIGLMQIMPRTGQGLAREVGLARFRPEHLLEPELNVQLGVHYLASLLRQYRGDLALTLAAYNAGPARAARWRTLPESQDPELLMERIPFTETREYVRHVKLHLALYRELYPDADRPGSVLAD